VADFEIGCRGVGRITFLEPIDLRGERDLCHTVVFQNKSVAVYPDDNNKPPVGQGLNHPAIIRLEHCYPVNKETGQPVVDTADPRVKRKIEKLKGMEDTEFISYDAATGTWEFRVEHFSRYGKRNTCACCERPYLAANRVHGLHWSHALPARSGRRR